MNNDDDNNDMINRRIQILAATIQMAEICLFDVSASNQNVAIRRDDNVAIGNFIVDVSDPRHAEYQQACLRTREHCVNNRWMHLYDAENFYWLQNAIIHELKRIKWNFD
jgi:hypothetical protein